MPKPIAPPIGAVFACLTVIGPAPKVNRTAFWQFRCVCGTVKNISAGNVKSGSVKSCGCQRRAPGHTTATHRMCGSRTYAIWGAMRTRCNNPNSPSFYRYGGRGISVCDRWNAFENFLADVGEAPPGMTIDRYPNNDGDYEPNNFRWATRAQQALNTSKNRVELAFGESKPVSEWIRDPRCVVLEGAVWSRLRRGWELARAITEPSSTKFRRPALEHDRLRYSAPEESGVAVQGRAA